VKINYHRLKKGGEDFPELCKFNGEQSMKNNRIILVQMNPYHQNYITNALS